MATARQLREAFGELEPSERCPHARAHGACYECSPEHLTLDPTCAARTVLDTHHSGYAGRCRVCSPISSANKAAAVAAPPRATIAPGPAWEIVTPYGTIGAADLAEAKAKAVEAAQVLGVRSLPVRRLGRAA